MNDTNAAYYAVVPARVRYDRTIPDGAKLLYGEITALCDKHGYCWASNRYFADLYGKSNDTISRWMSALSKAGHICYIVDNYAGNTRKIWLAEQVTFSSKKNQDPIGKKADTLSAKTRQGYPQKCGEGIGKNADKNNTYNNTSNNLSRRQEAEPDFPANGEKKAPPNSAAPPPFDIEAEAAEMLRDDLCRERAAMQYRISADQFIELVAAFSLKLKSEGDMPKSRKDFRQHFFNWAALEVKRRAQPTTTTPPRRGQLNNNKAADYGAPQKF